MQIGAMIGVASTWCLLSLMFFGVGRLVCRMLGFARDGLRNAFLSFWIGWGATILLLQLWHLYFPVDVRILVPVAMLGLIGLAAEGRLVVAQVRNWCLQQPPGTLSRVALVVALLVALWSSLAIGPPLRPDTANYHMAAVRWNSAYPIVPGLGNLHGRLAFNNSSFLYAAMLDLGPWSHRSHHLAHGLLAVVTMLYFLASVPGAFRPGSPRFSIDLFRALCFPVALLFTFKGTSSLQPDFITFLLGLIVSSLLFELLVDASLDKNSARLRVFAVCFLSSVGLTVKLSFLPLGLLASVIALAIAWRQTVQTRGQRLTLIAMCCVAAVVAIAPWTARGVVLSGYPAYPSTFGGLDVAWKVPVADVELMRNDIVAYARLHGPGFRDTLNNWDWLGPLILRELGDLIGVTIPLVCTILALVGVYRIRQRTIRRSGIRLAPWCVLAPSIAAVLFMALTAPCPRFAGAAIWVIAIGCITLSLDQLDRTTDQFQRGLRFTVGLAVLLLVLGVIKASRYTHGPFGETAFVPTPQGEMTELETAHGVRIHVATEYAWDAPLPNAPQFDPRLALIRDGDLSSGFQIRPLNEKQAAQVASGATRVKR